MSEHSVSMYQNKISLDVNNIKYKVVCWGYCVTNKTLNPIVTIVKLICSALKVKAIV